LIAGGAAFFGGAFFTAVFFSGLAALGLAVLVVFLGVAGFFAIVTSLLQDGMRHPKGCRRDFSILHNRARDEITRSVRGGKL
jgi:hypothetical protein